jgi:thymidylate kinase
VQNPNALPKVICLGGGDGTGKTAHATQIIKELQTRGAKCRYEWFGQPYLLSYPFMFLCNKLGYTKNHKLPNHIVCQEHQYWRSSALAFVWPWIQLLDLAVLVLLRVYLPVWRGSMVVCDRFVYDTLVEVMTDTNDPKLPEKAAGKMMLSLRPAAAVVVRLNVSAQTAFSRKNDVPDERFLRVRRDNYERLSSQLHLKTVNAEEPFQTVHRSLMENFGLVAG